MSNSRNRLRVLYLLAPAGLLWAVVALAQGMRAPPERVEVSGSVQSFPPDGGTEVRVTNNVRLEGPSDVNITGQSAPLDSNITNAYLGVAAPGGGRLQTEVTGLAGGSVITTYSGTQTMALNTASLNFIAASTAERICTYAYGDPDSLSLTTTPASIGGPLPGRTAITIHNKEATRDIWCSTTVTPPSNTVAMLIPAGAVVKVILGGGAPFSCMCSSVAGCRYAYLEEACVQPPP